MSFGQYSAESRGRRNPSREDSKQVVEGKEKKVRQVYPTDEIPHLWAHQTQTSARNQLGNLYFSGRTIYSYGSHFPIATIARNKQGEQAFIVTTFRNLEAGEKIAAWRAGHIDSYALPYISRYEARGAMLRMSSDRKTVETSRGVNFPVEHARRGLVLVRAVRERGEEWRTNGHTCHLGHYQIDRIESDGTVHAGCHVVEWQEIERIAPDLEATDADEEAELLSTNEKKFVAVDGVVVEDICATCDKNIRVCTCEENDNE